MDTENTEEKPIESTPETPVRLAVVKHKVGRPKKGEIRYPGRPPTHFVYSKRFLIKFGTIRERQLFRLIYNENEHLTKYDLPLVHILAIMLDKMWVLRDMVQDHPLNARGDVNGAFYALSNYSGKVSKLCDQLALNSKMRMELGLLKGDMEKKYKDLLEDDEAGSER